MYRDHYHYNEYCNYYYHHHYYFHSGQPGPAEVAGVRLGDIIIAVNYVPCREGSKTLLEYVKMTTDEGHQEEKQLSITLQCWRCNVCT